MITDENMSSIQSQSKFPNQNNIIHNYSLMYKFNTNKNTMKNMVIISGFFYNCTSLISLPDISEWKTDKVIDMSELFYNCSSLKSLPDISKWKTNNVINMNKIFYRCSSLISLPKISKWNTSKVKDMHGLFYNCSSLISLPDISKWKTNNVINMSEIFYYCSSLSSLPDISLWDTSKVEDITDIFGRCRSASFLPNISKWNTLKLQIKAMHTQKKSILYYELAEERLQPEEEKLGVFYDCLSLMSLPNLNNWNINALSKNDLMLNNCISLIDDPFQ